MAARTHYWIGLISILFLSACSSTSETTDPNITSNDQQNLQSAEDELSEVEKEEERQILLKMSDETLKEFYSLDPDLKEKVEQAYGYALFDDYIYNFVFYVAGHGSGVAYKMTENGPSEPIYMIKLRAGTGPGIGYAKHRQLLIIENETTFDAMMSIGLDVQASANATVKIGDFGGSLLYGDSFNPYLDIYTITDAGLDIQANWGAVEYIKDWALNPESEEESEK